MLKCHTEKKYILILLAISCLYIYLSMHFRINILEMAGHDDAWFIDKARSIATGHWLGKYNEMTFLKGPGYSLFLSLNNFIGTPITLSTSLLFVASCIFFTSVIEEYKINRLFLGIIFTFILFNPIFFSNRIIRDNIYYSLMIISISGMIYIARQTGHIKNVLVALSGFALGIFWMTREESVWILPGFLLMAIVIFIEKHQSGAKPISIFAVISIYMSAAIAPNLAIALANDIKYGTFQITDTMEKNYIQAMNTLNSVEVGAETPFVPVSQEKRAAIYEVSPSFRQLKPYFEAQGKNWTITGCQTYPQTCGDYAGGWFMWALREGVKSIGYYRNPSETAQFYARIVREIKDACQSKELHCAYNPVPFLPRLAEQAWETIPTIFLRAIEFSLYRSSPEHQPLDWNQSSDNLMLKNKSLEHHPGSLNPDDALASVSNHSIASDDYLARTLDFLGNPKYWPPATKSSLTLFGFLRGNGSGWIYLKCQTINGERIFDIEKRASPIAIGTAGDPLAAQRQFFFTAPDIESCAIYFNDASKAPVSLIDIANDSSRFLNDFHFEAMIKNDPYEPKSAFLTLIHTYLNSIYRFLSIFLFIIGAISSIAATILCLLQRRFFNFLLLISWSLWILYISRLAVLVLVEVSSFPAINNLYMRPAFFLWQAACFLGIAALYSLFRQPAFSSLTQQPEPRK